MRRKDYKKKINKLTFGLFDTLIDLTLFTTVFYFQSYSVAKRRISFGQAIANSIDAVKTINPKNFERVVYKLKTKGYLEKKEDYFKITRLGQKRLEQTLPKYEEKRPWDGVVYLITYDIPEARKKDRDFLRKYLQTLGCAKLQQSVWLTPYNPKKLVVDFIKERKLFGQVLVSELREGSGIGGKDILEVVKRVYNLDEINDEYRQFVRAVEAKRLKGVSLIMTYLNLLKKDPQLPFELLLDGFWGEDAYEVFKKEVRKLKKS